MITEHEVTISVNGGPEATKGHNSGNVSADRLKSLVERIERLDSERKVISADIADIYKEAKSAGFEPKIMRQLIRIRAQDPAAVEEAEALLTVYRHALGMA